LFPNENIQSPTTAPDSWRAISNELHAKFNAQECYQQWQQMVDVENDNDERSNINKDPIKGPWTTQEDDLLRSLVEKYGTKHWSLIAIFTSIWKTM